MEQADRQLHGHQGPGEAQAGERLQGGGQVLRPARRGMEGLRHRRLRHRSARCRDAARARDPAAARGVQGARRGRGVGERHPRRARGPRARLRRGARAARMGRGARGAGPEGRLARARRRVPGDERAARPYPRRQGGEARGAGQAGRRGRGVQGAGPAHRGGRIRVAFPVARLHGAGLRGRGGERRRAARVWTGSQKPHYVRNGVAALLGLPPDKVRAIWVTGPGSYGRNDAGDAALDAAFLSKAVGKPVRVQGMRADGTAWDPKGPASVHARARGARCVGPRRGLRVRWRKASRGSTSPPTSRGPPTAWSGRRSGIEAKPNWIFGVPAESYGFDNKLLAWETIAPLVDNCSPLRTGHLRDPVGPELHFASESFIDELAARGGRGSGGLPPQVPHQSAPCRGGEGGGGKGGLEAASSPSKDGKGRGISFAERNGTSVAAVAEVEVDRASGRVWARRFLIAHDCGLIINPLGLRQTIEGNVVQGAVAHAVRGGALRPRLGEERRLGELPDPRDAGRARSRSRSCSSTGPRSRRAAPASPPSA